MFEKIQHIGYLTPDLDAAIAWFEKAFGATNARRVLGNRWGLLVYLLDFLKGLAPVLAGLHLIEDPLIFGDVIPLAPLMGGAAVVGHCFPPQLGFRGGKGVATGSGAVLALTPLTFVAASLGFGVALAATRMVSVGSCVAALSLPATQLVRDGGETFQSARKLTIFGLYLALAVLVLFLHRSNIGRILRGAEPKIGSKTQ